MSDKQVKIGESLEMTGRDPFGEEGLISVEEVCGFLDKAKESGATHLVVSGESAWEGEHVSLVDLQPVKLETKTSQQTKKRWNF